MLPNTLEQNEKNTASVKVDYLSQDELRSFNYVFTSLIGYKNSSNRIENLIGEEEGTVVIQFLDEAENIIDSQSKDYNKQTLLKSTKSKASK